MGKNLKKECKAISVTPNNWKKVFEETHRITKEGRFLVVNTSPVIVPRISRSHSSKRYPIPFDLHTILVNQGWEFIDDIIWQKPEYSVKNRVGGFQQHRKPLGYKPNSVTEYLMVYRKKTDRLLDWNIHQYPKDIVEDSKVFGNFDTSNVINIDGMFYECEKLKDLDLSHFNTGNVVYMSNMFANCKSLTSLDLSCFDTSKVKEMIYFIQVTFSHN